MRLQRLFTWLAAAAAITLAGCSTAPRHPVLAEAEARGALAPLLPVRRFVANRDFAAGFTLSPDGRSLLWAQAVGTDTGLAVRPVEGGAARTFATGFLARPAGPVYAWLPDSRHVAYLKDLRGDENTQLHVFDTRGPFDPWHVTPWPGVRSYFVSQGPSGSSTFLFASNRRDRSTMDLYEADASNRTIREVARSDGLVTGWLISADHQLVGRARQLARKDGSDVAVDLLEAGGTWRTLRTIGGWDTFWIHRIEPQRRKAWGVSNVGRDKTALVEIDLDSGRETVLASHPVVDLGPVFYTRFHSGPVAYVVDPGKPVAHYVDAALGAEVQRAAQRAHATGALDEVPLVVQPQSSSEDGRWWVLRARAEYDEAELLLDRQTGNVQRLDPAEPERRLALSPTQPFSFTASDGRTVHGYYIRPRGATAPVPLVVRIHGGPWVRDTWSPAGFDSDQFLANRGYAVLTVNYRGSSGYGRAHLDAGRLESFGRVQKDIAEAAQWLVDQRIADPARMAVLGGSYGGFSVMAQLIQKHHDWKCGVNMVGVANWARVIENWPPFWRNRHMFEAFYGDPADPQQRERMLQNSPITHIDKITAPMLVIHGANDIRVLRQDSDEVVEALRKLGRLVEYLSFPDEGHSVRRWRNRLEVWRRVEDMLAGCLGGRSAGWDLYQVVPR